MGLLQASIGELPWRSPTTKVGSPSAWSPNRCALVRVTSSQTSTSRQNHGPGGPSRRMARTLSAVPGRTPDARWTHTGPLTMRSPNERVVKGPEQPGKENCLLAVK